MRWKERKGRNKKGGWQACVTAGRFTRGCKSRGEREGGRAHVKGSVCEDRGVNWADQSDGRTALYAPPAPPSPPHTLPSGYDGSLDKNTRTPLTQIPSSLCLSCVSLQRNSGPWRSPLITTRHKSQELALLLAAAAVVVVAAAQPSALKRPRGRASERFPSQYPPMRARVDGSQGTCEEQKRPCSTVSKRPQADRWQRGKRDVYEKPWEGNPSWRRKQFMSDTRWWRTGPAP